MARVNLPKTLTLFPSGLKLLPHKGKRNHENHTLGLLQISPIFTPRTKLLGAALLKAAETNNET
ncbi:MAG: hypothetical protein FDW93_06130 [Bergeyella sp.]|nr:hypothetical protein [Bergeyella sp.]